MNLYHYSENKIKIIESLRAGKRDVTGERLKLDPTGTLPPYSTSISFFLSPIPDNLPEILDFKHSFWQPKKIYQYVVNSNDLPEDVIFYIAETPERSKYINNFDWNKASNPEIRKKFMEKIRAWEVDQGLIGQGLSDFNKKASKYMGDLSTYYKRAYSLSKKENDLESFFSKYASYVPHVMLYHEDFKIPDFKSSLIILKDAKINLGKECFNTSPVSLTW